MLIPLLWFKLFTWDAGAVCDAVSTYDDITDNVNGNTDLRLPSLNRFSKLDVVLCCRTFE
jgi:hypothetical protein